MKKLQYDLSIHGDYLEREYVDFIRNLIPNYEFVWKTFIGNNGNNEVAEMAKINKEIRMDFAENSYTTFESLVFIKSILQSNIFITEVTDIDRYITLNQNFILFFSLVGRIKDTLTKASNIIGCNSDVFEESLKEAYEKRNIVLHGKKVPFIMDEHKVIRIPQFNSVNSKGLTWDDKRSLWEQYNEIVLVELNVQLSQLFEELILIVNNHYGLIFSHINSILKKEKTEIEFSFEEFLIEPKNFIPPTSGSLNIEAHDIYKINKSFKRKR